MWMTICVVFLSISPILKASETINLRKTVAVEVVAKTKDAVVNISTAKIVSRRVSPFGNDPFFQQFDVGQVQRIPASSLGSGFIIHSDGYVVTNNHVVDRARQITVELADGRKLPAELLSADSEADLAILRVRTDKPLPTLELGDSSDLMIGEPTIAVGNPLGFSHSVSTGIISAIHRDLKDNANKVMLGDLIQTDAAINPGNSGGPLLNAYGQVIGINTAIRGDAQNIGFAIPVNRLRNLIPELMDPAHAIKVQFNLQLRERRQITPPAQVTSSVIVTGATPAKEVVAIAAQPVKNIIDAYAALDRLKAGEKVEIRYADGASQQIVGVAVPLPDALMQARKKLGITIEPLTPMLAEKYRLDADDGMLIKQVDKGSIAAKTGIQPGDIIVQIGRYRVGTLDDFSALLQRLPEKGKVQVGIRRGDQFGLGILEF
jgi:serine protease Do